MSDPTRADLLPLLELQQIDTAIDRLRHRRQNLPEQAELDGLMQRRVEEGGVHAERSEELQGIVREQTRLETDIQMLTERAEHERERLASGSVTSPREMANIQAELDALGRRTAMLEDQDLEVMEQREELEKVTAELASGLADLDSKIADTTARRDAAGAEIDAELAGLDGDRTALTAEMNDQVLEMYESVREKHGGIGAAALENGTCRACSLPLSPMAKEQFKTSDEVFVRCENCRRLLVTGA